MKPCTSRNGLARTEPQCALFSKASSQLSQKKPVEMNASVASATEEQTEVVEKINQNITQINDLAGLSADRSRAIDGISDSLERYAKELENQTGKFNLAVRFLRIRGDARPHPTIS